MDDPLSGRVRLGDFEIDLRAGDVRSDAGGGARLQEKSLRVLILLTEHPGELVTRDEIQRRLWPNDTIVDFENGINTAVKRLRQALDDSADHPRYIENIPRRGYRLLVPVEPLGNDNNGDALETPAEDPDGGSNLLGRKVSHYRVLEVIGGGGMGLVYKAEDLKLGRQVALKFLPPELAGDPVALQRFEREARAASSFDHPHICTIHAVDEYEGQPFIVMQLLEGETLRDRLARLSADHELLPLNELLNIGVQVCEGLQAAHDKGIVHRDIKPANIFIANGGQAKILDFGLAKLIGTHENQEAAAAFAAQAGGSASVETTLTRTGTAMGTAGYMSPEQVRREELDARTDIFSFGLVLYEMAARKRAFAGATAAVVHESILNDVPVPARELNSEISPALEAVINRALEKDRDLRYQSAAELGTELRSIEIAIGTTRRRLWVVTTLIVLFAGIAIAWFVSHRAVPRPELLEQQLTANPEEDYVTSGAISPDGKYVIYNDQTGVYLRSIDSGETRPVAVPEGLRSRIFDLCWLPGGEQLLATAADSDGNSDIWVITVLGKADSRLLYRNGWKPAISPDSQMIAFSRDHGKELWVGGIDGEAPRKLLTTGQMEYIFAPSWSPDSQWITYGRWKMTKSSWNSAIEMLPARGGAAKTLVADSSLPKLEAHIIGEDGQFTESWSPDWRLLFSVAGDSESRSAQTKYSLWKVNVDPRDVEPVGKPERLTQRSESSLESLSIASDGKRVSFVKSRHWMDVYLGKLDHGDADMKAPRRVTLDTRGSYLTGWTLDSQAVLFDSARNGRWEIFRQVLNENVAEVIISSPGDVNGGEMSPDGSWLLYWESEPRPVDGGAPPDSVRLMRRATGGGSPERILELHSAQRGAFSCSSNPKASTACVLCLMDGRAFVFYSLDPVLGKGRELGKIAIATYGGFMRFAVSPDGSRLAMVDAAKYQDRIELLTLADGVWHEVALQPGAGDLQSIAWATHGNSLFAISVVPDSFNLLHVTLAGKVQPLLRNGHRQWLTRPVPSPDGKHLAFSAQTWDRNVWMIENF